MGRREHCGLSGRKEGQGGSVGWGEEKKERRKGGKEKPGGKDGWIDREGRKKGGARRE